MPQEYEMRNARGGMYGMGTNKNRQMATEGKAYEASVERIQLLFKSNSADLDPTQQSHYTA